MAADIPSIDPADAEDFTGAFRHIFGKMMQSVDGMLPARVISYNRTTNRATVQPLVMLLTTGNKTVPRAQISSVPVFQYGGGDFLLSFPVKAGDIGWIQANDRDISLFLQRYSESAPNTVRKKSFSDAVFYPDVMRGYTIAAEDNANAVLQNLSGTVRISLWPDKVKITAPTVEIDAATTHITGVLNVDGNITSLATITGTSDVIAGGISGKSHVHGGVTAGTANTGAPQ